MNKKGLLSVDQQRVKAETRLMAGIGLECHLRNLVREIMAGDLTKLVEFQQSLQYAPPEMQARISEIIPV